MLSSSWVEFSVCFLWCWSCPEYVCKSNCESNCYACKLSASLASRAQDGNHLALISAVFVRSIVPSCWDIANKRTKAGKGCSGQEGGQQPLMTVLAGFQCIWLFSFTCVIQHRCNTFSVSIAFSWCCFVSWSIWHTAYFCLERFFQWHQFSLVGNYKLPSWSHNCTNTSKREPFNVIRVLNKKATFFPPRKPKCGQCYGLSLFLNMWTSINHVLCTAS